MLVTGFAFAKGNGPILVGANPSHPAGGYSNRETTLRSGDPPAVAECGGGYSVHV